MAVKQLHKLALLVMAMVLLCAGSGFCADKSALRPIVSPELLKAAGLKMMWQNKLPIRPAESLDKLLVLDSRVYMLSDRNFLVSMDSSTGKVSFSKQLATAGLPIIGLERYGRELFLIAGNKLFEISPEFGSVISSTQLEFSAVCPAARNKSFFYVASGDSLLYALRADDKVRNHKTSAYNNSVISSVIADKGFVVFTTNAGDCVCASVDLSKRLWQFNAADSIVGPVIRDGNTLIFASRDTNLYKLDITKGRLIWKYQAGDELQDAPVVTKNLIYQYVHNKGITAINKKTGSVVWRLDNGLSVLSEYGSRTYVITRDKTLVVMDNKQARRLYTVNFAEVSGYAVNVLDARIYISAGDGRIGCVRPVN